MPREYTRAIPTPFCSRLISELPKEGRHAVARATLAPLRNPMLGFLQRPITDLTRQPLDARIAIGDQGQGVLTYRLLLTRA